MNKRVIWKLLAFSVFSAVGVKSYAAEEKALKEYYKGHFSIGCAMPAFIINKEEAGLIKHHFSTITCENEMKPGVIHPAEGVYNWEGADKIVEFAMKNGLKVRGHVLVWHEQVGDWFFTDNGKPASRELLLKRVKEHITTIMQRYKGKVYCWDVLNEAIDDDSTNFYRKTKWYEIIGEDYAEKVFQYAHEADPEALLFYNDYNENRPEKRERIYKFLKSLLEKGVPVHGMGMQGHYSIFEPTESDLKAAIEKYASLGLQIHFTEIDISVYPWEKHHREKKPGENDELLPDIEKKQVDQYNMLFRVMREHKNSITNVTFWGLSDRNTWLNYYPVRNRKNYPLLFDRELKPKKVFFSITDF